MNESSFFHPINHICWFQGVQEEAVDRVEMYSDEDEDYSSPEEGSDSEPMLEDLPRSRLLRKGRGSSSKTAAALMGGPSAAARQRNIKQKFVALLKKFKVTDPGDLDHDQSLDQKLEEGSVDPAEIEDLFDQLEDLSDSGPDLDTISIGSTPKPSLKPFFCSSRNLLQETRAGNVSFSEASKPLSKFFSVHLLKKNLKNGLHLKV